LALLSAGRGLPPTLGLMSGSTVAPNGVRFGVRSKLARALAAAALVAVVAKLIDGGFIYSQATLTANPRTGHTVPVSSHGRTIYLTQEQLERDDPLHWTSCVAYVLALAAALVEWRTHRKLGKKSET
jgi:hypothetical protein